ncbi:MAG: hypothetical protein FIA92_02230 [Chloroflexi bacterium]|nr:hypothetical protein [Chloroflexota bacterium]
MTSPGLVGVVAQLVFAIALGGLSLSQGHASPEPLPRGLAIGLLYATPAVVGWLGTVARRRSLLLAAAAADVVGAPLSWSFVTLLFLVPAILFVGEMGRLPNREMGGRSRLGQALAGVAVAALLVGAGVALLGLTEPLCWIATQGPAGISYQIVPDAGGIPIGPGQSAGCDSAALTLQGIGLAAALALAALGLAFFVAGGRAAFRSRWEPTRPS